MKDENKIKGFHSLLIHQPSILFRSDLGMGITEISVSFFEYAAVKWVRKHKKHNNSRSMIRRREA